MANNVKKDEGFASMIGNAVGHAVEGVVENIVKGGDKNDQGAAADGGFSFATIGKVISGFTNSEDQPAEPRAPVSASLSGPAPATIIRTADPPGPPPPAAAAAADQKGGLSLDGALSLIGGKDDKKDGGVTAVLGGLFK